MIRWIYTRWTAKDHGHYFQDVVVHKGVYRFVTRDGKSFMGHSRWGLWVECSAPTESESLETKRVGSR